MEQWIFTGIGTINGKINFRSVLYFMTKNSFVLIFKESHVLCKKIEENITFFSSTVQEIVEERDISRYL
jgi:hypothetical protein